MKIVLPHFCCACLVLSGMVTGLHTANPIIVHEWGTFTSLQDENGQAIGGINVVDEPVPYFVSSVAVGVAPQYDFFGRRNLGLPPYRLDKGWISGDPRVTMRLETPVLYLYPPKGQTPSSVPPLDVRVDFHGGVLSQFYPHAEFSGLPFLTFPGQPQMDGKFPYVDKVTGITEKTTTTLDWKGVRLGSTEKPIETNDKVWTTPREVSAPLLEVHFSEPDNKGVPQPYTQAEHFLFYRGVGHLDSPLALIQGSREPFKKDHFYIWPHSILGFGFGSRNGTNYISAYPHGWLTAIRSDGACAFRDLPSFKVGSQPRVGPIINFSSTFSESDFKTANLTQLKASMQAALEKEGLYPDEASAMLRTWELSYFKSPGLRFFYIVPRAWVDKVLPLKITGTPTEITRVMVGRIELITDAQWASLKRLAAGPCPDLAAVKKAAQETLQKSTLSKDEIDAFYRGEKPLSELGIPIPPLVQDYLSLGRFRDALIVHEQQLHPSPALAQFIKDNGLAPQQN